ncbi:cytochrome P450 [Micromonospora sp. WMMD1120]|uniref:cytochrome P450 n=1 Tax=Micromonospora sp. WMMD1120 TaxID=3016106 RepID=UPI0024169B7A|nr:cytochrome P450 [Micromonospora sp. WMMD1120]MDG4807540.1 cytochrome P450 [Micromonospora sp. WMMD1120]
MREVPPDLTAIDLTDPATFIEYDQYAMWRRFRAERPVHRHPGDPGFWVLTRYADVKRVYRDDTNFTSERGNVLQTLLAGQDTGAGQMLVVTDGPRHTAIRKLILESFSPRALRPVLDRLAERTASLLDELIDAGTVDFAERFADRVPIATICDLLGVPPSDHALLLDLNKKALSSTDDGDFANASYDARISILYYFAALAQDRREEPRDDVISALANTPVDGTLLTEQEVALNSYSLILGGDETSRLSMIGAVEAFHDFPDQWRALREGAASVASATEEILRFTSPAMAFGRRALADVTIGGERIAAGSIVTVWNNAANRDEAVFPEPERFLIGRTPNRHLSLGYGPHFCLGAFLARAELGAMLDVLRANVSAIESCGPARPIYSNALTGSSSLPVSLVR